MTVMCDLYFGQPQAIVRLHLLAAMSGSACKLYAFLWHESERLCTRELAISDATAVEWSGLSRRTLITARKSLRDAGLIQARSGEGGATVYVLCDPRTRRPWPGDARQQAKYIRKLKTSVASPELPQPVPAVQNNRAAAHRVTRPVAAPAPSPETVPLLVRSHVLEHELPGTEFPFGFNDPDADLEQYGVPGIFP